MMIINIDRYERQHRDCQDIGENAQYKSYNLIMNLTKFMDSYILDIFTIISFIEYTL